MKKEKITSEKILNKFIEAKESGAIDGALIELEELEQFLKIRLKKLKEKFEKSKGKNGTKN